MSRGDEGFDVILVLQAFVEPGCTLHFIDDQVIDG